MNPPSFRTYLTTKLSPWLYQRAHSRALFSVLGLVIRELRVCFRQFFSWRYPLRSLFRSLKYGLLSLLRLFLGRSLRQSYSFTGEDRILEALIKKPIEQTGFYVDVGCNHPVFLSNTFLFYRRGWRGIAIDANEKLIKQWAVLRPRDKAVAALVSDTQAPRTYYELTNNVLSTTETLFLDELLAEGQQIEAQRQLTPKSLTSILDEGGAPPQFDILSVDAEEHDLQVLQSLDFSRYQPRLIVTEAEDFDPLHPSAHPIYQLLEQKGYYFEGYILKNLYFRHSS